MMKGIVDRIENKVVIVEIDNEYINFELEKFPKAIKEGDLVQFENELFTILEDETLVRKKEIRTLFDSLLEKEE